MVMNGNRRRFICALILLLEQNNIVKAFGTNNIHRTTKHHSRTDFLVSSGAAISLLLA